MNKIFMNINAIFKLISENILSSINQILLISHEFIISRKFNFIKLHFNKFLLKKLN